MPTAPRYFYPRSPCGERPALSGGTLSDVDFYPRSPCGERRGLWMSPGGFWAFLSTLSLRRATVPPVLEALSKDISIHALLAESDRRGGDLVILII